MSAIFQFMADNPMITAVGMLALWPVVEKVLLPLLATCQDLVIGWLRMATRLILITKTMSDSSTQTVIYQYLNAKARGWGNLDDQYEAMWEYIRPLERKQAFFARFTWHTWRIWLWKRAPIWMVPNHRDMDRPAFQFLRGTINWDKLVMDACAWRYERDSEKEEKSGRNRFKIIHMRGRLQNSLDQLRKKDEDSRHPDLTNASYDPVGWRLEDLGPEAPENATDVLAMNEAMNETLKQVDFWKKHKQWYKDRDIPWKIGVMLYGPPGTGKTSLVRAIAMMLDLPVFSFDLSTMDSADFIDAWEQARQEPTRIVLLEDIDTVFNGRDPVDPSSRLSFDVLLNTLDGIEQDDGMVLFVTTNRIDCVDEALGRPDENGQSTRPGRIDLTFEIGMLDFAGRLKLARRILKDEDAAQKMALDHEGDTPVVFRERCRRAAIMQLWGSK